MKLTLNAQVKPFNKLVAVRWNVGTVTIYQVKQVDSKSNEFNFAIGLKRKYLIVLIVARNVPEVSLHPKIPII